MERKQQRQAWYVPIVLSILFLTTFCSMVWGDDPNESNPGPFCETERSPDLGFDPNNYSFLIYDSQGTDSSIVAAMQKLGISVDTADIKSNSNPVTLTDLQTHNILIIGWNEKGYLSGLDPNVLVTGINGRVLLSGHDADYHTVKNLGAAERFLIQAIRYVLAGRGTGLIALGDIDKITEPVAFTYLPSAWGLPAISSNNQTVETFTDEGLSSGVYDGLKPYDPDPAVSMSNWKNAYHNIFTIQQGSAFVPFEIGSGQNIVTVAKTKIYGVELTKVHDVNDLLCRGLGEQITYTISYVYPYAVNVPTLYNVSLVDYMPQGADYYSSSPAGSWDIINHKVTWPIGTLTPGSSGVVYLTVTVNELSEPMGQLLNKAVLQDSVGNLAEAVETTKVCCWGDEIIYVDEDAAGVNTGTSWYNAYADLQSALVRAANGCGSQIWVSEGTYSPGIEPKDTFTIPAGVSVYGGFAGWETNTSQRSINASPTILTGDTGVFEEGVLVRNETVVTMGDNSLLDGFFVREASSEGYGVFGEDIDYAISNCTVDSNEKYGIYAKNGNTSVNSCIITYNKSDGVFHFGNNGKALILENCRIENNGQNGLNVRNSIPTIRNNQIAFNGSDSAGYYGLNIFYPQAGYDVRNNTVIYNTNEGIYATNPNGSVTINNCILWGNDNNSIRQLKGSIAPQYSLVYDPNNPNQPTPDATTHNVSCNPKFAHDGDPNVVIYHLLNDSPCIDRGNPFLSYASQTDIDDKARLAGMAVEMGADEVDCMGIDNEYDWNADGLVNLDEFAFFSQSWLAYNPIVLDPNNSDHAVYTDPNGVYQVTPADCVHWDSRCDFAPTGSSKHVIDISDLILWASNAPWLWKACWLDLEEMQQQQQGMMSLPEQNQQWTAQQTIIPMETHAAEIISIETAAVEIAVPEKSIAQQLADIKDSAKWLEELWETEPELQHSIDAASWKEFMDAVYENVKELEQLNTETLSVSEELQ